ncbi:MAG: radical SAM protein [Candidatus Omnitrophota bacterium]
MKVAFGIKKIRILPNLGIAYLSYNLKRAGHEVKLFEIGHDFDSAIKKIKNFNPKILAFSVYTGEEDYYINFNRQLRGVIKAISILGGPHPTFMPDVIEADKDIDAICRGEGELAFVEFLDRFSQTGRMPENVANFWVKNDKAISRNNVRALSLELDSLGVADREIYYEIEPALKNFGKKHFIAHRGCPYTCTYCFNHKFNELYQHKNIYRSRTVGHVIDEILEVKETSRLDQVLFLDDVFVLNKDWLSEFTAEFKRRVSLPYSVIMRLDNCSEEIVRMLKESGCFSVTVGIEAGTDFVRNKLMKRNMGQETIINSMKLLKKYSLKVYTENIIGLPGETYEMAKETLLLNCQVKPDYANCSIFYPFPKTELHRYAVEHGYYKDGERNNSDSYYYHSFLIFKDEIEKNKIENLRCFFSFLARNPRFIGLCEKLFCVRNNFIFRLFGDLSDVFYHGRLFTFKINSLFRVILLYIKGR